MTWDKLHSLPGQCLLSSVVMGHLTEHRIPGRSSPLQHVIWDLPSLKTLTVADPIHMVTLRWWHMGEPETRSEGAWTQARAVLLAGDVLWILTQSPSAFASETLREERSS